MFQGKYNAIAKNLLNFLPQSRFLYLHLIQRFPVYLCCFQIGMPQHFGNSINVNPDTY